MSLAEFKPSKKSTSPYEATFSRLKYLRLAAQRLEEELRAQGEVPNWVQTQVGQAANSVGMALSYAQQNSKRKKK